MTSESNQQMFSGAQNFTINGGTFAIARGNQNRPGLGLLFANITPGAFHDAAERGDPPKCYPRTRVAIRKEIMQWIKDSRVRQQFIIWLYGPAGSGKTAIGQSIAEACAEEDLLAASFFFGRAAPGRNTSAHFIATLAYQLSISISEIEDGLFTAIEKDPAIFSRSLSTQMRVLIIKPLISVRLSSRPRLVVTDGIDECGPNDKAHAELLQVLGTAVVELKGVPIIFLIGCRPEYEIRTAFQKYPLISLTKSLALDNTYSSDRDIEIYFESEFLKIQRSHLPLLRERWPNENDVNFLVKKASGQFVYASTVIKFIDSPRCSPADRLKIILHLTSAGNETPFAPLDALYFVILDSVTDIQKVLEILTFLLLSSDDEKHLTLSEAEELLGFDVRIALVDMHALMFVPSPTNNELPRVYHASLDDFLKDQSRSQNHHINESQGHVSLGRHWLRMIGVSAQPPIPTWRAINAFIYHCSFLHSPSNQAVLDDLASFDLKASLKKKLDFGRDRFLPYWNNFMKCVRQQGGDREDIFPRLQKDFDAFIFDRIGQYPRSLLPYVPILLSTCNEGSLDVFDIMLHAASTSVAELNKLRDLDGRLLNIFSACCEKLAGPDYYICELLQDTVRAGKYFVDCGSYSALAKAIVSVICTKPGPGERNYQIAFDESDDCLLEDSSNPTMRIALMDPEFFWFEELLIKAPIDTDFAYFLCEHAVQLRNDVQPMPGRRIIAEASIKYIQRCGISFLIHAHQPHTNECAICTKCEGAVVVESISTESPRS